MLVTQDPTRTRELTRLAHAKPNLVTRALTGFVGDRCIPATAPIRLLAYTQPKSC